MNGIEPRPTLASLWSLAGRVAVVTGGGNGIGRAGALRLSELGAAVVVGDRDAAAAGSVSGEIAVAGGRAIPCAVDVGDPLAGDRLVDAAADAFGGVDVLVQAAGIYPHAPLLDLELDEWDRIHRINLRGCLVVARACGRRMLAAGGGSIVNVASRTAARPPAGLSAYASSKAGVVALTKSLALELAPTVRVNAVAPGAISDTATARRMQRERLGREATPEEQATIERRIGGRVPLGRTGRADEVARVIAFLAVEASSYVNGAVVPVDGGDPIP